jgi:hypothetical protein
MVVPGGVVPVPHQLDPAAHTDIMAKRGDRARWGSARRPWSNPAAGLHSGQWSEGATVRIGEIERIIEIEPLEEPVPRREGEPEAEPVVDPCPAGPGP